MFELLAQADPWYQSQWFVYPALVVAGFVAGIVNTLAGGGSFLTLPVFMYLGGLEPKAANATNRVAVLLSSGSAARVFHRHGLIDKPAVLRMLIPTLVGVPCGALTAVYLPADLFRGAFGVLFLLMAAFFCVKPKMMLDKQRRPIDSRVAESAMFFGIGLYSGFIQAGMGLLLLVGMSLFHARELVGANAVKNVIGFSVVLLGLTVFVVTDLFNSERLIHWLPGLTMAAGNLLGGVAGAHLAIRKGEKLILAFLIVVMVATGVKMIAGAFG